MMRALWLVASLTLAVSATNGWVKEVVSLPGWSGPLPSRVYSGYVNLTGHDTLPPKLTDAKAMFMHYFFFESEADDPTSMPLVVWWNGGPGATSAWGLFVENGPYLLNEESVANQSIRLIRNPYSWTKFANVIAFCNPPPVGFSFCEPEGPTGNGTSCGTWNDTRVGITDAEAIRIVVTEHFPNLMNQPIFFMGESYAGVYIGETLKWMLAHELHFGGVLQRLAGVALGDACLGGDVLCGGSQGPYAELMFFYGHGQVSTELWNWLLSQCTTAELRSRRQSATCQAAINTIYDAVGGYYAYNLVDQCLDDAFQGTKSRRRLHSIVRSDDIPIPLENGYWCPGQVFFTYFDRSDVRNATFVPLNSTFFNADDGEGMNYIYNTMTVMPTLLQLLTNDNPNVNGGQPVAIWAYDGDTDPSVNVFSTQEAWWRFAGNHTLRKTREWSSWTISDNIVGGYVTEWLNGTLQYVTIRGSGHMVAEYKPASAFAMARSFVLQRPLQPFVSKNARRAPRSQYQRRRRVQ